MEFRNQQLSFLEQEHTPEEKAVMYVMSYWKVEDGAEERIYNYYRENGKKGLQKFLRTIYKDCGFSNPNHCGAEYIGKMVKFCYGEVKGEMNWDKATELVAEMIENNTF